MSNPSPSPTYGTKDVCAVEVCQRPLPDSDYSLITDGNVKWQQLQSVPNLIFKAYIGKACFPPLTMRGSCS